MPQAVEERIAVELVNRLKTIVVTEDQNTTLVNVVRAGRDPRRWTITNNSIFVVQGEATRNPAADCPGNPPANGYDLEFGIICFIRQKDSETIVDDATKVNELVALARHAIAKPSDWQSFGLLCYDADFGDTVPFTPSEGSHSGGAFDLLCQFRVSENDPFEVRA